MQENRIGIGSIVKIFDKDMKEENTYHIVLGNKEKEDELSCDSPLGKVLIGHKIFDVVTVKAEEYEIEIIDIDNSNIQTSTNSVFLLTKKVEQGNRLSRNLYKGYGTRAKDIYIECCKNSVGIIARKMNLACLSPYLQQKQHQKDIALFFWRIAIGQNISLEVIK